MIKLGANSVLFGGFDLETAFKHTALSGYDGIEVSAIPSMSEHLVLEKWRDCGTEIKRLAGEYGLELLAMEQPNQDPEIMETAMQSAVEIGIPVINCGPGGKEGDEASLRERIDSLGRLALRAEHHGVTLCVKAHVGAAIHDTPTTLQVLRAIDSPAFGLDMDPSHIHRAGEEAVTALRQVIHRIKHVHIRDCRGRGPSPGEPRDQANGRGDIDLVNYIKTLHDHGYSGALDLEVIGTKKSNYTLAECCIIAAEARGHMQACLQACGAR